MESWKTVTPDLVLALLEYCDGWNVLDSSLLKEEGFPEQLVDRVTEEHRSKQNGKAAVLGVDCSKVDSLKGVFCLDLLYNIAKDLELSSAMTKAKNKLCQEEQAKILVGSITKYYSKLE